MAYNTHCALCRQLLTPKNTKPGFGLCVYKMTGRPRNDRPDKKLPEGVVENVPTIFIKHALVCVGCADKAREINEKRDTFVYDVDGPTLDAVFLADLGYNTLNRR